ncbi:hypothetical protein GQ44DRAFT_829512 [Phaeosphaeriaceae sp. PMI808]|nr:hypothetical protein GQ44DRAFT_829512 [Phaeosphaeriaceae sp. PMI808]
MCHLGELFYRSDIPPDKSLNPPPRLVWAVPIDIVELGASLEAYSNQLLQVKILSLCHRFGGGPLSLLPQEIIDHIISDLHLIEKTALLPKWNNDFVCFQGFCRLVDHSLTDEIWYEVFVDRRTGNYTGPLLKMENYIAAERAEMLQEHLSRFAGSDHMWAPESWDCHDKNEPEPSFLHLNSMLRSHFGLEVIIQHGPLSKWRFPLTFDNSLVVQHPLTTSCFLVFPPDLNPERASQGRGVPHQNEPYMCDGEVLDPTQMRVSENQNARYNKAMRILNLELSYHMSELNALLISTNEEETLSIYNEIFETPHFKELPRTVIIQYLEKYTYLKSRELTKQSWLQPIVISDSGAVYLGSQPL